MTKVEDLQGIQGTFEGSLRRRADPNLKMRALADGEITYVRDVGGDIREVTIPVKGVSVRRLNNPDTADIRRYVRVERGPKENRDKIIALIDRD